MFNGKWLADGSSILGGSGLSICGYYGKLPFLQLHATDFVIKYADAFMIGVMGGLGGFVIKIGINFVVKKYKNAKRKKNN